MNRRAAVVVGVTIALVAAAGAGFAIGSYVGGGGTQPEDVLPDTMVVYADVDLDPSAEQKVNLVRLLGRFPDVEDDYGDEPDLRQVVIDRLVEGTALQDASVEEWVGDRLGGGVSWAGPGSTPTPVMALQVTDEDAALDDLRGVVDDEQVAVTDGYLVVTGNVFSDVPVVGGLAAMAGRAEQTADQVVAAGQQDPLADSAAFTSVFAHLDDGLLTLYADAEAAAAAAGEVVGGTDLAGLQSWQGAGQAGAVLRAEPSALELLGWSTDAPRSTSGPATLVEGLPSSTVVALEATGAADALATRWSSVLSSTEDLGSGRQVQRRLSEIEAQYGVRLPDDLKTLLGSDVLVAADGGALLTGLPGIGLRSVTDPDAAADLAGRLQRALDPLTGGFGLEARGVDDGLVVATSQAYADTLESAPGGLTDDEVFAEAVPDAGEATALLWVDLETLSGFAQLAAPEVADALDPLAGLGVAATPEDDGSLVRLRLVFTDASGS